MLLYEKVLNNINHHNNAKTLGIVCNIVSEHAEKIAKNFYREMLSDAQAANFLNHDEVKKRLTISMTNWLCSIFEFQPNDEKINYYKESLRKIGHIHGRIGLPVSFVNYGMYLLKQDVLNALVSSNLSKEELGQALILSNQVLDCALQIINESYESDLIANEKDSQAFKIQFSTHHLALDCERLRTSLSDWMRDLLLEIHSDTFDASTLPTIRHSNFGLWITHKAKLFISNRHEFKTLIKLLDEMDDTMYALLKSFHDETHKQNYLKTLNELVSQANWILAQVAKEIIDQDSGRDSLTRLFSRRYLDTVMRHETATSLKNGVTFGVILLDIDFFKKINDTHGHESGDKVLEQLAEILNRDVRAGDFIFRLGGRVFDCFRGCTNFNCCKCGRKSTNDCAEY